MLTTTTLNLLVMTLHSSFTAPKVSSTEDIWRAFQPLPRTRCMYSNRTSDLIDRSASNSPFAITYYPLQIKPCRNGPAVLLPLARWQSHHKWHFCNGEAGPFVKSLVRERFVVADGEWLWATRPIERNGESEFKTHSEGEA